MRTLAFPLILLSACSGQPAAVKQAQDAPKFMSEPRSAPIAPASASAAVPEEALATPDAAARRVNWMAIEYQHAELVARCGVRGREWADRVRMSLMRSYAADDALFAASQQMPERDATHVWIGMLFMARVAAVAEYAHYSAQACARVRDGILLSALDRRAETGR